MTQPRGSLARVVAAEEEAVASRTRHLLQFEGGHVEGVTRQDARVEPEGRLQEKNKQLSTVNFSSNECLCEEETTNPMQNELPMLLLQQHERALTDP